MTSEPPFKNLHQPEGFKSTEYKLQITEWLLKNKIKKEK
jgi:hypothetical protein